MFSTRIDVAFQEFSPNRYMKGSKAKSGCQRLTVHAQKENAHGIANAMNAPHIIGLKMSGLAAPNRNHHRFSHFSLCHLEAKNSHVVWTFLRSAKRTMAFCRES